MAHEKLNFTITQDWARRQAETEPEHGVTSVGGLAQRATQSAGLGAVEAPDYASMTQPDPRRQSLAKFVELSRRRQRLSLEKLAEMTGIDLAELLAIEQARVVEISPRSVVQLSAAFDVNPQSLMELAGLVEIRHEGLTESATRFAARSEPMQALSKDEEEALDSFVRELAR